MNYVEIIKSARRSLKMSQSELAVSAGVSLATLQNIESGRANPELATLKSVLAPLGLELLVRPAVIDLRTFAAFGLPLLGEASPPRASNVLDLIRAVQKYTPLLVRLKEGGREEQALASWLWAIRDHYASLWAHIPVPLKNWFSSRSPDSLKIKLRRLALAKLSEFM